MESTRSEDTRPATVDEDVATLHRDYWAIFAMPRSLATRFWRRFAVGPLERQALFNGAVTRLLIRLRAKQIQSDRQLAAMRGEIEALRAEIAGLRAEVARRVAETEESHVGLTEILRAGLGRRIENLGERHAVELARLEQDLVRRTDAVVEVQLELARLVNAALAKLEPATPSPEESRPQRLA